MSEKRKIPQDASAKDASAKDTSAKGASAAGKSCMLSEVIKIERMSYGADAIGHLSSGKTVFVQGAVPQDEAEVEVFADKKRYAQARMVRLVCPSPLRVDAPLCARQCGGCPWAHLSYEAQCAAKYDLVADALKRVAHFPHERAEQVLEPIVSSDRALGYRNKIELAVRDVPSRGLAVGFYGTDGQSIYEPDTCFLANDLIAHAPKALRGVLRYFQNDGGQTVFRAGVRASDATGDIEIALWTPPGSFPRKALAQTLVSSLNATSVVRLLAEEGSARAVKKVEVLDGKGYWCQDLAGAHFAVSAPSFFQVNTSQAEKLIELVVGGLEITKGSRVADLYAGAGTFSIPLALSGARVVAVESSGSASRDLVRNARTNNVDIEVICQDVARAFPLPGDFDAIVLDPPASGLDAAVIDAVVDAQPEHVGYVSCDPQTWARDVERFEARGMRLVRAIPVDMFPQTYHVEVVSFFSPA